MKKLYELVELQENNSACVILKVKENVKLDLISLGYFNGDEEYLRLTKGDKHTCTVFKQDGKHYSWYWGRSGYTVVSDEMKKRGQIIQRCIEDDFNISID